MIETRYAVLEGIRRVLRRTSDLTHLGRWPAALISGLIASVVVALWFTLGEFWATTDFAPFVRESLQQGVFKTWSSSLSPGGSATYSSGRLLELVFTNLAHLLGGGDPLAQRLMFAALAAWAAAGTTAAARSLVPTRWIAVGVGLFGAFNATILTGMPNPLLWTSAGTIGFACAVTFDAASGRQRRGWMLAMATLPASYLVINPPLLIVTFLAIPLMALASGPVTRTGWSGTRRALAQFGFGVAWMAGLHCWWIPGAYFTVSSAAHDGRIGAQTNVATWSWTHRNNSLWNIARMLNHWNWPNPQSFAYGSVMESWWWKPLSFIPPLGVIASPWLARRSQRRVALYLLASAAVLVFVGKGLHEPFSGVNLFLYRHVPGMWLLREPHSKLFVLLALVYVLSWTLLLDGVNSRRSEMPSRPVDPAGASHVSNAGLDGLMRRIDWRRVTFVTAVLLGLVALAFPYPMWTGEIVRDTNLALSSRVKVPEGWYQLASTANRQDDGGSVAVVPLDDFYQMATNWGYYGVDTMVGQLITRRVAMLSPGSYYAPPASYAELLKAAEAATAAGDTTSATALWQSLGVTQVLVRRDLAPVIGIRDQQKQVTDPQALIAGLDSMEGAHLLESNTVGELWQLPEAPVVYATSDIATGDGPLAGQVTAAAGAVLVAPSTSLSPTKQVAAATSGSTIDLDPSRATRIGRSSDAATLWSARRAASSLVLREAGTWTLGSLTLPGRPEVNLEGPSGSSPVAITAGNHTSLTQGDTYFTLPAGTDVTGYFSTNQSALGSQSPLSDCNAYDERTPEQAGLRLERSGDTLTLGAQDHSACVSWPLDQGDVWLEIQSQSVQGRPTRWCVSAPGNSGCVVPLAQSSEPQADGWSVDRALLHLPSEARLYLYADRPLSGEQTVTRYRALNAKVVETDHVVVNPGSAPTLDLTSLSQAGPNPVARWVPSIPAPVIGPFSAVADCNRYEDITLDEAGISATVDGTAVLLRAQSHSACVTRDIEGLTPGTTVTVDITAQVEGSPARLCLQIRKRCLVPTRRSEHDQQLRYTFLLPQSPDAAHATLFLYADASRSGAAAVRWDTLEVTPAPTETVWALQSLTVAEPILTQHATQENERIKAVVSPHQSDALLVGRDASSSAWQATSGSTRLDAVRVDNWRSAWLLPASESDQHVIAHWKYHGMVTIAQAVSILALLALALCVVIARSDWWNRGVPTGVPPRND